MFCILSTRACSLVSIQVASHPPLYAQPLVWIVFLKVLTIETNLHHVFLIDEVALVANGEKTGLGTHVTQVSTVEPIRKFHNRLIVNLAMRGNGSRVNLQNVEAALFIGQAWRKSSKFYFAKIDLQISILRSKRPGRRRAGSRQSGRFVAMIIFTWPRASKPSIWFSNSIRVLKSELVN